MTVVVAYVPGPLGRAAVQEGMAESRRRDEPVLLINSSRGDAPVDARWAPAEEIEAVTEEFAQAGIPLEVRRPMNGREPAEDILGAAEEVHASVIVLGVRHRSRTGKLLFGSTTQTVILQAACAVLCVKQMGSSPTQG